VAVSGWEFGADLSELKKVGSVDLPSMSYTFASLNSMVNGTEGSDKNAFEWVGVGSSQAYQPWAELRDSLQNFLGKTAQNLEAAASAIDQIVQTYAASPNRVSLARCIASSMSSNVVTGITGLPIA